jgi:hypothetical protein
VGNLTHITPSQALLKYIFFSSCMQDRASSSIDMHSRDKGEDATSILSRHGGKQDISLQPVWFAFLHIPLAI